MGLSQLSVEIRKQRLAFITTNREGDLQSDLPSFGFGTPMSSGSQLDRKVIFEGLVVVCSVAALWYLMGLVERKLFNRHYKAKWKKKSNLRRKGNNWRNCWTQRRRTNHVRFIGPCETRVYQVKRKKGKRMVPCGPVILETKRKKSAHARRCRIEAWLEKHRRNVEARARFEIYVRTFEEQAKKKDVVPTQPRKRSSDFADARPTKRRKMDHHQPIPRSDKEWAQLINRNHTPPMPVLIEGLRNDEEGIAADEEDSALDDSFHASFSDDENQVEDGISNETDNDSSDAIPQHVANDEAVPIADSGSNESNDSTAADSTDLGSAYDDSGRRYSRRLEQARKAMEQPLGSGMTQDGRRFSRRVASRQQASAP